MADAIWGWLTVSATLFFLKNDTKADHKVFLPLQICAEGKCPAILVQAFASVFMSKYPASSLTCVNSLLDQCPQNNSFIWFIGRHLGADSFVIFVEMTSSLPEYD